MPRTILREEPGVRDLGEAQADDPLLDHSATRAVAGMSAVRHSGGPITLPKIAPLAAEAANAINHEFNT